MIELRVVQFWSEIILVISNRSRAVRSFNFEITRMISDQIALHSVQLLLLIFAPCYVRDTCCSRHFNVAVQKEIAKFAKLKCRENFM